MLETIRPEEGGLPSQAIIDFLDWLEKYRVNMHGFSLVRRGKILAEGYWAPFQEGGQHRMYSVGKSLVSLAVGLLESEGRLKLGDRICSYFPEMLPDPLPPFIAAVTIEDMLTMRSAHSQTSYKSYQGDWVESFFHVAPTNRPGSFFSYDTSSSHVLTALVEKLTGMKLLDFLRERFLGKIGLSDKARILPDPRGISQGGSGFIASMEDLRNIGLLCLNGGKWEGEQLIPAGYLKRALSFQADTSFLDSYDQRWGYGYQFWKTRRDGFALYGLGGQLVLALPESALMLTTVADTQEDNYGTEAIHRAFWDIIVPACRERGLPPDDEAYGILQTKTAGLTVPIPSFPEDRMDVLDSLGGEWLFTGPSRPAGKDRLTLSREGSQVSLSGLGKGALTFGLNRPAEGKVHVEETGGNQPCYGYVSLKEDGLVCLTVKIIGEAMGEIRLLAAPHGNSLSLKIRCYGDKELEKMAGIYNGEIRKTAP